MKKILATLLTVFACIFNLHAKESYTRIVDVGPELCTITKTADGLYFLYDAGHWEGGHCYKAVTLPLCTSSI